MLGTSTLLFPQKVKLKLFPGSQYYEKYFADDLSPQFSISKHLESNQWFGVIGGDIQLFNLNLFKFIFQSSINAMAFNTLIKTPGHIQVFTIDYRVDFNFDTEINKNLYVRFLFGHLSAHYADDGITQLNSYPISYVRDYIGIHLERKISELNGKIYIGSFYNYHNEPVQTKHSTFQLGGDGGIILWENILLYTALDIKVKSEVNYGTTQSYQLGLRFPYSKKMYFRIAFTHRRGFEERGQLYNLKDNKNSIGVFIDF